MCVNEALKTCVHFTLAAVQSSHVSGVRRGSTFHLGQRRGRASQAKETVSAKVLRQEGQQYVLCVGGEPAGTERSEG